MKKKIFSLCLFIMLLIMELSSVTALQSDFSNNNLAKLEEDNKTEYWGVIISTFSSNESLNDALISSSNWNKSHILFLNNTTATHQAILDSLDWLIEKSDKNDYVLFAERSHGTGDRKKRIYGICPIDNQENGTILVQTIDEKLDEIKAKGMCLIFDCCLSGSFVNKLRLKAINIFGERNGILKNGVEGKNRVVLMSTMKNGLGVSINNEISFFNHIANAIDKKTDNNKDEYSSAEELFRFAKRSFLPWSLFTFFLIRSQVIIYKSHDFFIKAFPTICDNYKGHFPLVKI